VRTLRALAALAVAVWAAWLAAAAVLFGFPSVDHPRRADAIVVLSGERGNRLAKGLELARTRVAPVLVISDGLAAGWTQANRLCRRGGGAFRVVCVEPQPDSTRGEAETVARLARARHWRSLVLVTSTYHVTRARILFERCFPGRVQAVGTRYPLHQIPSMLVSEMAKLLYELTFARSC
jgi:uncharacterized SAM-binding protein YcdF (DUF218 family)